MKYRLTLQHHPSKSYAQRIFEKNVGNMYFTDKKCHHAFITRNTKVKGKFESIQAQCQLLLLGLPRAQFAFACSWRTVEINAKWTLEITLKIVRIKNHIFTWSPHKIVPISWDYNFLISLLNILISIPLPVRLSSVNCTTLCHFDN